MNPTQGTLHSEAVRRDILSEMTFTNSDLYNPQMPNFSRIVCRNIKKVFYLQ